MLKQLTDQDASFLYLETPETPQHVGGVSLVELPPDFDGDFFEDYKRHIAERVHMVPLMHRKLVSLPFDLDHPFWAEDDAVDVDYHVRHQTLPRPGRMRQLEELVGRLHSNFLDRSRPLWELYLIDGLENGQVAIYSKIHHAAMDGSASQQLVTTLYDVGPVPRPPTPKAPAGAAGASSDAASFSELLQGVAGHVVRKEVRALHALPDALKAVSDMVLPDANSLKWHKTALPPARPPQTPLNVAITSQRVWAARTLPLSRIKRLAKAADAKVNDVVLALCATALRHHLDEQGELPGVSMTAMVPMSLHQAGEQDVANQNAVILCALATHLAGPLERLLAVRDNMREQKRTMAGLKNVLLPDLAWVGSGLLVRGMVELYRKAKLADRLPPLSNVVVSNVPGPPVPLYVAGARVLSFHPCSIPYHGQALNITVQSYCDALDVGLVACRRTLPDLAELADRLAPALEELEAAVAQAAGAAAPAGAVSAGQKPKAARGRSAKPTPAAGKVASKSASKSASKTASRAPSKTASKTARKTARKTATKTAATPAAKTHAKAQPPAKKASRSARSASTASAGTTPRAATGPSTRTAPREAAGKAARKTGTSRGR